MTPIEQWELSENQLNTTYKTIDLLEEMKVIEEITGAQRGKLYTFTDYINLFK